MKTLIIPDIHTKWEKAQKAIEKYPADEVICLGDYFDDFDDTPEMAMDTATWLKDFISRKNTVALVGNHEFNYLYGKTSPQQVYRFVLKIDAIQYDFHGHPVVCHFLKLSSSLYTYLSYFEARVHLF